MERWLKGDEREASLNKAGFVSDAGRGTGVERCVNFGDVHTTRRTINPPTVFTI